MKLEVGKRYVLRNGEVTGPLRNTVTDFPFEDDNHSWTLDGKWNTDLEWSTRDIVSEYIEPSTSDPVNEVEPQPQQPLRWVENCKPDKPGIWATIHSDDEMYVYLAEKGDMYSKGVWCYLGPIPEILPPVKKVVQRFWISRKESSDGSYYGAWFATEPDPKLWIRTDETREVEQ